MMCAIEDKFYFDNNDVQFEFYNEHYWIISINVVHTCVDKWILALLSLSESVIKSISVVNTTTQLKILSEYERSPSKHKSNRSKQNIDRSILFQDHKYFVLQLTKDDIECIIKWYLNCRANTYEYESMILDIECRDRDIIMFSYMSKDFQ
jgi:hypothetical protein